jgi:hypothetical protein
MSRIADGDLVVEPLGHLRQESRKLARADDEQPPTRPVHRGERRPVEDELVIGIRRADGDGPGLHVEPPLHQLVVLHPREQLVDAAVPRQRLEHELERPAARQAEALGLLGRDAVLGRRRLVLDQRPVAHLQDHVVLDATAGHGTHDHAVVADRRERADRPRRRAPRAYDDRHHHAAAVLDPVARASQNLQVNAVHKGT